MPTFSKISKDRLATCHSDLQRLFNEVIKDYDCTIVCGYRGPTEQKRAYSSGKSKVNWPNSKHNKTPSLAVDAAPWEGKIDWSIKQMYSFAGYVTGVAKMLKRHGVIDSDIRSGGDWDRDHDVDDQTFIDLPHFEIVR